MNNTRLRLIVMVSCLLLALGVIAVLGAFLKTGFFADFLLDRQTTKMPYPFTVQNLMWVVFFIGCGELYLRHQGGVLEKKQVLLGLLPEDTTTVLRKDDLGGIYKKVRESDESRQYMMQRLLSRCILQFQGSSSIGQVNNLFNSSIDLYQHEIDLRYNIPRYIVWLIPTLGFIGTVIGIALALNSAGAAPDFQDPKLLKVLTKDLGVAFYTTLLALLMSSVLVFVMHIVQGREEAALNRVGQYCLDNLINRLYAK